MCLYGALCARGLHSGAERSLRAQKRLPRNGRTVLDYIKGVAALRREKAVSNPALAGLAVVAAAGVACLVLATFATLIEIRVGTTTNIPDQDTHLSGWDRHGPALLVIAAFAAVMIAGALRGARPAMAAIAALGLAALLIAVVGDVPDLDKTGFIGEVYEDAAAGPKGGFYLETLGGVLLLAAGGLMLAVPSRAGGRRAASERPAPAVGD